MSIPEVERNEAYFASRVDRAEVDRLTVHARLRDAHVRDGLRRIGIGAGQKAIDVGCGPLGALLVLAELVGPTGTVVGLDMDEPSLERAGSILRQRGHDGVRLVHANVSTLSASAVCPPGPFDVAVCSQFLNNQPDPVDTLRRIGGVVRSGGHLLVQSPLFFDGHPRSEPEVPAVETVLRWFGELMRRRGASPNVAREYHRLCQAAGLIEVSQRGFFLAEASSAGTHLQAQHAAAAGISTQIIQHGIASREEVDETLRQLKAAAAWEFHVYFAAMHVELIAQIP
jgi:ubiquinone/menaquinone biosynthesis C-methylase UbiE